MSPQCRNFRPGRMAAAVLTAMMLWLTAGTCSATAVDVFINYPDKALQLLSREQRMDMVDYYRVKPGTPTVNQLKGNSVIDSISPSGDYMKVNLTDVSTLQIGVFGQAGKQTAVAVYSIGSPQVAGDSEIYFFSDSASPLPLKGRFEMPQLKDFITVAKGSPMTQKELMRLVPFPTFEYVLMPGRGLLRAYITVGEYMTREDMKILKPYLRDYVDYRWTGKGFKLIKQN